MNESKSFTIEIVTPESVVYTGTVERFQAKSPEGYFEVLYNHTPLLVTLSIGHIKLTQNGVVRFMATSGGFVEVFHNTVTVLAQTAEPAEQINTQRAQAAHERAVKRLQDQKRDIDVERSRISMLRALSRLKVKSMGS